jgi:UDP-N-acetylmuramyl pentapeptide phosphotransferase/UDP-N-acetylglucosamine-1-phosphate transferase
MINLIGLEFSIVAFIGILFAFVFTCAAIAKFEKFLPRDMGRAFAHDGKLSAGKPRGAGIIFIFTFAIAAVLFAQVRTPFERQSASPISYASPEFVAITIGSAWFVRPFKIFTKRNIVFSFSLTTLVI